MPKVAIVPQERKYRLLAAALLVGEMRFIAKACSSKTDTVRPHSVSNWWNRGVGMPLEYEQRLVAEVHRIAARNAEVGDIRDIALAKLALHLLKRDYPARFAPRFRYDFIREAVVEFLTDNGPTKAETVIDFFGEQEIQRQTLYNALANYSGVTKKNSIWSVPSANGKD